MVVVVARSGKALSAHVTGVRFLTLEEEISTNRKEKLRKYAKEEEMSTNGKEKLRKRKYAPVCKRMWYIRPTLVVSILLQCGHFSCWPPVCKKWVRTPKKIIRKIYKILKPCG